MSGLPFKVPPFNAWLQEEGHAPHGRWVLARRTKRIVERYGEDVVCFSQKRVAELNEQHRVLVRDEALAQMRKDFAKVGLEAIMVAAYEAGRTQRWG